MIRFSAETYQNEYLAVAGTEVNAIVTVRAEGNDDAAIASEHSPTAAVIILLDVSGSMGTERKLELAKRATATAIDGLRDDVMFAVIAGNESAKQIYPRRRFAMSSADTRVEAKQAVARLDADGGTAISRWLASANELFESVPDAIRYAILLTDGRNDHETTERLQETLRKCAGNFQCDCRGVGTDWNVQELRAIASTLLGTVDIIPDPEDMPDTFRTLIDGAMNKATHDVTLEVWTPQGAHVSFISQVAPTIDDLTASRVPVDALVGGYPTGAWGNESRDYHLCVNVSPQPAGEEMLAARVRVVVDGQVQVQARVRAVWTDDPALSTRINREVAHYTGQVELAREIQAGLAACAAGDAESATTKLGRAYRLAAECGNDATIQLLEKVLEVDDATAGSVRLRRDVALVDEMTLDTRSTKTVRVGRAAEA